MKGYPVFVRVIEHLNFGRETKIPANYLSNQSKHLRYEKLIPFLVDHLLPLDGRIWARLAEAAPSVEPTRYGSDSSGLKSYRVDCLKALLAERPQGIFYFFNDASEMFQATEPMVDDLPAAEEPMLVDPPAAKEVRCEEPMAVDPPSNKIWIVGSSEAGNLHQMLKDHHPDHTFCYLGKKGNFVGHYIRLIQEKITDLQDSQPSDKMFVTFTGNMMLEKEHVIIGKKDGLFHLVNPRALNAVEQEYLVRQVNSVLALLRTYFSGEIIMLGPWPRHLKPSPKQIKFYISGNPEFNMVDYTNRLNQHLKANLVLPDRSSFVDYTFIFRSFPAWYLSDNVHLHKVAREILADFCFRFHAGPVCIVQDNVGPSTSFATGPVYLPRRLPVLQAAVETVSPPPASPASPGRQKKTTWTPFAIPCPQFSPRSSPRYGRRGIVRDRLDSDDEPPSPLTPLNQGSFPPLSTTPSQQDNTPSSPVIPGSLSANDQAIMSRIDGSDQVFPK